MRNPGDWDPYEDIDVSDSEQRAYAWDVIKTGLRFLIFTTVLYTLCIWGFSNLLQRSNIISGNIDWHAAGIIGFGIIFLRLWDRTFFK